VRYFQPVSDASTNLPFLWLTSEFRWDLVLSKEYGRQLIIYDNIFALGIYCNYYGILLSIFMLYFTMKQAYVLIVHKPYTSLLTIDEILTNF
jgi:hypothetical protein